MNGIYTIMMAITAFTKPQVSSLTDTTGLRAEISATFAKQPTGTFAVAFKDLATGIQFFINEHALFHAASTMKTPVMVETFKQAAAKKFALSDSILVKGNFKSIVDGSDFAPDVKDDSETDLYTRIGTKLPISDLLYRMITKSSNLATNNMVDLVDAKNVNATMRAWGANDIQILRGVEDHKAFDKGLNNKVSAYDLMLVFEKIATGKAVDKTSSDAMISILMNQHFTSMIPGKLPAGVKTATKSGSIEGVRHDSGIVFLPDGRKYVIVLLSSGIRDEKTSTETLATVSKIIYDHVVKR